ncbi:MAG: hypothetical protein H6976_03515 [Gammaproteobacteria bacterium]|nr:hypothetical protein [Gammaproteobacteria bacterium]
MAENLGAVTELVGGLGRYYPGIDYQQVRYHHDGAAITAERAKTVGYYQTVCWWAKLFCCVRVG